MEPLKEKLTGFQKRLELLIAKIDTAEKQKRIKEIELESANPGFWDDRQRAEKLMQELTELTRQQEALSGLGKRIEEAQIGLDLMSQDEAEKELREIGKGLDGLELKTFLSGPYDRNDAILSIHSGQGGTEAMDWAEMLERMYLRFIEKKGWKAEVVDLTPGEEAGIKSATITINGHYAYGYLKGEAGTHRLVRQSPFNADRLRQTSFALIEVLPKIEETAAVQTKEGDLEWEFFRSSTQGGQNVQKVSTAVRVRHKPTGITVTCQSQRYQEQNRKIALLLLTAKLWAAAVVQTKEEKEKIKGEYKVAGWGNQIRSYVLHPYKLVKDLRTGVESSNPESVLDGDLDLFVEAEVKNVV